MEKTYDTMIAMNVQQGRVLESLRTLFPDQPEEHYEVLRREETEPSGLEFLETPSEADESLKRKRTGKPEDSEVRGETQRPMKTRKNQPGGMDSDLEDSSEDDADLDETSKRKQRKNEKDAEMKVTPEELLQRKGQVARSEMIMVPPDHPSYYNIWDKVAVEEPSKYFRPTMLKPRVNACIGSGKIKTEARWKKVIKNLKELIRTNPKSYVVTSVIAEAIGSNTTLAANDMSITPDKYLASLEMAHLSLGVQIDPFRQWRIDPNVDMKTNYSQFCMENGGRGADPHELDDAFVVAVANSIYAEQWNQPAGGFKTVFIGDRVEMLTHCRAVDLTIQTKSKAWPMNPLNPEGREYTDTQRELRTEGKKKTSKRDKPKASLRCHACDEEGHFESDCKILKRFKEYNHPISYGGSKICGFHGANNSHATKTCKNRKRFIEDPERDWFIYHRNNRQPQRYDNGYRQPANQQPPPYQQPPPAYAQGGQGNGYNQPPQRHNAPQHYGYPPQQQQQPTSMNTMGSELPAERDIFHQKFNDRVNQDFEKFWTQYKKEN